MRIRFQVIHQPDGGNAFPLSNAQIQHEYSTFGQMLSLYFSEPKINASCAAWKPSEEGVILTVEGDVTKAELTNSVQAFLLLLNSTTVSGRIGQPNFVASTL